MPGGAPGFTLFLAFVATASCARPVIPDPKEAVASYADAVRRGDAEAVHEMMSEEARQAYGLSGTRRLLSDSKQELLSRAESLMSDRATVAAAAVVHYSDGEQATLVVQQGTFRISAAEGLPSGAKTPAQALGELRQVLARRSYSGLMGILTSETRAAVEAELRALVEGLEHPQALPIKVQGDRAEVEVPGGHKVWLKREAGSWRIVDFD